MEGIVKPGEVIIRESKYINQESAQVVVSFELSYHDWSKVENSDAWKTVLQILEEIRSKDFRFCCSVFISKIHDGASNFSIFFLRRHTFICCKSCYI